MTVVAHLRTLLFAGKGGNEPGRAALSLTVLNAIGLAAIIVFLVVDYLFFRLVLRLLVWVIERLLSYRPGRRYKSRSSPERYARFRKSRNGS
jgi:membrane protein implicated in regulation of membrane protease activity